MDETRKPTTYTLICYQASKEHNYRGYTEDSDFSIADRLTREGIVEAIARIIHKEHPDGKLMWSFYFLRDEWLVCHDGTPCVNWNHGDEWHMPEEIIDEFIDDARKIIAEAEALSLQRDGEERQRRLEAREAAKRAAEEKLKEERRQQYLKLKQEFEGE